MEQEPRSEPPIEPGEEALPLPVTGSRRIWGPVFTGLKYIDGALGSGALYHGRFLPPAVLHTTEDLLVAFCDQTGQTISHTTQRLKDKMPPKESLHFLPKRGLIFSRKKKPE